MPIFVDGVEVKTVFVDSVEQNSVFVDGVEVFTSGYTLTVAQADADTYGFRDDAIGVWGDLQPRAFEEVSLVSFNGSSTADFIVMFFNTPPANTNNIIMTLEGAAPLTLTVSGETYVGVSPEIVALLAASIGANLRLTLERT